MQSEQNGFMSLWVTSHRPTDAAGFTQPPTLVQNGAGSYFYFNQDGSTPTIYRAGDYGSTAIDAAANQLAWIAGEFATTPAASLSNNNWGTIITNVGSFQTASIISELYTDILGRPVDGQGLSFWSTSLQSGTSVATFVNALESSTEYVHDLINNAYKLLLHRCVDPGSIGHWTTFLTPSAQGGSGGTVEQLKETLAGSQEYFQNRAQSNNSNFISALFQDFLNRTADGPSLSYWTQQLSNGQSRQQVATSILMGTESLDDISNAMYEAVLHRSADPSALAFFTSALGSNAVTDQSILATLLESTENLSGLQ